LIKSSLSTPDHMCQITANFTSFLIHQYFKKIYWCFTTLCQYPPYHINVPRESNFQAKLDEADVGLLSSVAVPDPGD
jgi:hypothetical protein